MRLGQLNINENSKPAKVIDRNVNKTIVKMTFEYKETKYNVEDAISMNLEKEVAIFLYEDGNYSDDATRRRLINRQYGENTIPELPLGSDEIDLIKIEVEYI